MQAFDDWIFLLLFGLLLVLVAAVLFADMVRRHLP